MCKFASICNKFKDLCLNGGQCKNLRLGGFFCVCPNPFYGPSCQFVDRKISNKSQVSIVVIVIFTFIVLVCIVISIAIFKVFKKVKKARATRGTYSPSAEENFGNSIGDISFSIIMPPKEYLI